MARDRLDLIGEDLRADLDEMDLAREKALAFSRTLVRQSATAIRLIHQGEFDAAEDLICQCHEELQEFRLSLDPHPRVAYAPFVSDGEKEHVEAWATLALATGRDLPTPEELGTPPAPYLNGLAEAVMEIRRTVVDRLRHDRIDEAEAILERMSSIYDVLVTFDYPDALLEGLKRRLDTVRGVLEKTRTDIATAVRQNRLIRALSEFELRVMPDRGEDR